MSERLYRVTLSSADGSTRDVTVPSKTEIQASDAAAVLAEPSESILKVEEIGDSDDAVAETKPAGTQTHPDWTV